METLERRRIHADGSERWRAKRPRKDDDARRRLQAALGRRLFRRNARAHLLTIPFLRFQPAAAPTTHAAASHPVDSGGADLATTKDLGLERLVARDVVCRVVSLPESFAGILLVGDPPVEVRRALPDDHELNVATSRRVVRVLDRPPLPF